jgi:O-antigen/teichoic acid export membrane protein
VVVINPYLASLYKLRSNRFIEDVTIIAGGTATAQLITIAFSPVITRLYGPDAFGILGVFTAVAAMVIPLSNLAYADAIVIPASESEAKTLVKLSFLISVLIFLILMLLIPFFHNQIAHLMGFDAAAIYLLLVPPFVLMDSWDHILRNWLIRKKQFKPISKIAIFHAAEIGATKSGFGLFFASAPLLIILNVTAHLFRLILTWVTALPTLTNHGTNFKMHFRQTTALKKAAYDYRDFPLYSMPQNLIFSFSQSLPTLMLAALFGPVSVGYYALSKRVLTQPFILISRSIGTAYLPRLAEAANRGEKLQPHIIKATGVLSLLGLLPFGAVIVFGPWLFNLVFGSEWVVAGEYARWLSFWLYFQFINVPCIKAIPILGLQGYKLGYEILSAFVSTGLLAFGALYLKSDIWAVALFSVGKAALYMGLILWVILLSRTRTR